MLSLKAVMLCSDWLEVVREAFRAIVSDKGEGGQLENGHNVADFSRYRQKQVCGMLWEYSVVKVQKHQDVGTAFFYELLPDSNALLPPPAASQLVQWTKWHFPAKIRILHRVW